MASTAVSNKSVILKRYVQTGIPSEEDMEVVTAEAPPLAVPAGSTVVVVKNLYLSCDPYMRSRMTRHQVPSFIPDFVPGEVLENFGVMRVISSGHPDFKGDDLVWGITGWEEYTMINNPESLFRINYPELPLSNYTSVLGMPGLTAYAGFFEVSKPKKGEFVFISAASGAVGQIVGQLAKITGCYVVGSAGSDDKVNLLKTKFGFDDAFNYKKEPDLEATLRRYKVLTLFSLYGCPVTHLKCFPEGIDIYFENVGGVMLDAVLLNMRMDGRIAMCGMISQYNLDQPEGVHNLFYIISKRLRMEGFHVFSYFTIYHQYEKEMAGYLKEGKVVCVEDIVEGLHYAPTALIRLFTGRNIGKQLVALAYA